MSGHTTPPTGRPLLVTVAAVALTLAVCGGSDVVHTEGATADRSATTSGSTGTTTTFGAPETTAPEPPRQGRQWGEVELDFTVVSVAGDAERLWAAGRGADDAMVLAWTDDGAEWNHIDLISLGLPTDSDVASPGTIRGQVVLGTSGDAMYGVVAAPPQPGVSADGVGADLWVVTSDGAPSGEVRVLGPDDTGLDQRLAGARMFRIMDLAGVTGTWGEVHVAAVGQWWVPFETSDSDFAALSMVEEEWSTFSEDRPYQGILDLAGIAATNDQEDTTGSVVAVGVVGGDRLVSYQSPDGRTWVESGTEASAGELAVTGLASSHTRFVAVGTDGAAVAWWSDDGLEWTRVELPIGAEPDQPLDVVWTGDRFLAMGGPSTRGTLWESPDGSEWSILDFDGFIGLRAAEMEMWADRIVAIFGNRMLTSPPLG